MNYYEVTLRIIPFSEIATDLISASLGEAGYESFVVEDETLKAYVNENLFDQTLLDVAIEEFPMEAEISYEVAEIEQKNWNEEWEKNYFQPIVIGNECVIHSTFHTDVPEAKYDILIDPKMAFGTGHHETTSQILAEILDFDFTGKSVLDMGCGTAVLAILAVMKGANPARAIDIDDWVCDNANENVKLNRTENIEVQCGDATLLADGRTYDVIFANINRNILLNDLCHYAKCMHSGSVILMSGFYVDDIPAIREEAEKQGLVFEHHREKNRWVAVKFVKP
ncbi:MAG: 50S ribosomal protein L11 methyltransferase [Bacteroidales bacterium]